MLHHMGIVTESFAFFSPSDVRLTLLSKGLQMGTWWPLMAAAVSMQPMMLKPANGHDFWYMTWLYGCMASFVERRGDNFQLTLRNNCKFQSLSCAIMFGSRVLGSRDYRLAVSCDHVAKCCKALLRGYGRINRMCQFQRNILEMAASIPIKFCVLTKNATEYQVSTFFMPRLLIIPMAHTQILKRVHLFTVPFVCNYQKECNHYQPCCCRLVGYI